MCLEIASSKKIAIEDMTVYKVIHANNTSAARLFHYEPGVLYTLAANDRKKFDLAEWDTPQIVNEGFHAYIEKTMAGQLRLPEREDRCLYHSERCPVLPWNLWDDCF